MSPAERTPATTRAHALTLVVLLVCSSVVVGLSASQHRPISTIDEVTHLDYVRALTERRVPKKGDELNEKTLDIWACYGWATVKIPVPPCGETPYVASEFPWQGINYNYFHPPLYYAIDAPVSAAVRAAIPSTDFLTSTRIAGAFWLTLGTFMVWVLLLELGVSIRTSRLTATLTTLLPAVVALSTMVNNDAAALLAGSAMLLAAVRVAASRSPWWLVTLTSALAATTKTVFLVAGIAAALLLVDEAWRRFRGIDRDTEPSAPTSSRLKMVLPLIVAAVSIPLVFGAAQFGWKAIQEARTDVVGYVNPLEGLSGKTPQGFPTLELLSEAGAFIPASDPGPGMPETEQPIAQPWLITTNLLLAAAPFALLGFGAKGGTSRRFAGAVQVGLVLGALVVATTFYVNSGTFKPSLNPRYGLALLPGALACLALLADRSERWLRALAALTVFGGLSMLPALAGWWS